MSKRSKDPIDPDTIDREKLIRKWSVRGLLPVNVREKAILANLLHQAIGYHFGISGRSRKDHWRKLSALLTKVESLWAVPGGK